MIAELLPVDRTQESPEIQLEFDLNKEFTENHQINLIYVEKAKGNAYFCTQSFCKDSNNSQDFFIDHVHLLKISLVANDKLSVQ